MHLLNHNNVDGYPSTWGKYEQKPTKEELVRTLSAYYEADKCNSIAEDLIAYGECSVNDGSCTEFTIEKV
jgi:hypothetical protein